MTKNILFCWTSSLFETHHATINEANYRHKFLDGTFQPSQGKWLETNWSYINAFFRFYNGFHANGIIKYDEYRFMQSWAIILVFF